MRVFRSLPVFLFGFLFITGGMLLAQKAGAPRESHPNSKPDVLLRGFFDPPNEARPRVWWHWMNGNISEEGIKLDLEWMHSVGLGGVTIFEGAINTPQVVPHRLVYQSPEWKQALKTAVTTAHGMGMEVAIASSPGWSETGGPWVPAAQGMKKMVWSETRIEGGKRFNGVLPHPPDASGTFQNISLPGRHTPEGKVIEPPKFYTDVAVIAYRIADGDKAQAELNPQVTASEGTVNVPALSDGDLNTVAIDLPFSTESRESWVQFDYGHPQTVQAVTLASLNDSISVFDHETGAIPPRVEASEDGAAWRKIAEVPFSSLAQRTASFDAVTARYFRIVFPAQPKGAPNHGHSITELVLESGARMNEWEKRAGYANSRDFFAIRDPKTAPQFIVQQKDVIDLTSKMAADGTLEWTPPEGEWMVLRIGSSLTGHENGPAPAEATGLEVDKFNREAVKNYLEGYLKMYSDAVGAENVGANGISHLLTDSIEVGPQNWTERMPEEFKARRGYDLLPWLPALTGVVVSSVADTDRFLWDFRRTLGQLLAENHYGAIAEGLHSHGMNYYAEALEYHRPSLGDDMEMRSRADIPMGAMWTWAGQPGPDVDYLSDLRGAASVAHIYGQNTVGAESMTSRGPAWSFSPRSLKPVADLEFALGVNRFEIHESTHQPVADMAPGLTLGPYGLWFNRNETWASQARPWVDYLARCSYLLQQGRFGADVAYFYGEEGPLTAVFGWKGIEDAPVGYGFDFVNSDVVLHKLSVKDGRLVTPGGTSYRILYLGGRSQRMTLAVLRQLYVLVSQGAVLVGNRPTDSPSLTDDEKEFQRIADRLWGRRAEDQVWDQKLADRLWRRKNATSQSGRKVGQGLVFAGGSANDVLARIGAKPDWEYTSSEADTTLLFVHRKLEDGEIYFVDNRMDRDENVDVTLRVSGKIPELWDAATGATQTVSYRIADGRTTIPLHLDPYGTTFVVLRKPAEAIERKIAETRETPLEPQNEALNKNWHVNFAPGRGAPETAEFERLASWSENADAGIQYFSGTATYSKAIDVPAEVLKRGARVWLDLGEVRDVAEIAVNGKYLGILWKAPFRIDVTDAITPGSNRIVIQVTNEWVNRLIGDQQKWALRKYAFADFAPYKADSPLEPSGLLGPVRLSSVSAP